jgi:hypothetical protein
MAKPLTPNVPAGWFARPGLVCTSLLVRTGEWAQSGVGVPHLVTDIYLMR